MKTLLGPQSLQTKLALCMLVMNAVMLIFSLSVIFNALAQNDRADRIVAISEVSEPLFATMEALTFERGRMNVILAEATQMSAANRKFIEERRSLVDRNLADGLERLGRLDSAAAARLRSDYVEFLLWRDKAAIQAELNRSDRDQAFGDEWFKRSTAFIYRIADTLEDLGNKERAVDVFNYLRHFQLNCLDFRLFSGYSGSVLTAAISQGAVMPPDKYEEFVENRAKADYVWRDIEKFVSKQDNPELRDKKNRVYDAYYRQYRPFQQEILLRSLAGEVSRESARQLADLSVPAFDSIFELIDDVSAVNRQYVPGFKAKAVNALRTAVAELFAVLAVIAFTIVYFRAMLFSPLRRIITSLRSIGEGGQIVVVEADAQRQDEIGLLTQGVKMLQISLEEERRLKDLNEALATTDKLTGLYNRHTLDCEAERAFAQAERYGEPLTVALFDLDHFKQVNDTWGHTVGDAVLQNTAQIVKGLVRRADQVFRVGGEEFLILMPQTDLAGAAAAVEKIRAALATTRHDQAGPVTASMGVAEKSRGEPFAELYKRADEALYRAKNFGRNRVECSETDASAIASMHLVWRPEWESGHPEIDAQHRKLLARADEFFGRSLQAHVESGKVLPLLDKVLAEITDHFAFEERVLAELDYPDTEAHKQKHAELVGKAARLREDYRTARINASAFIAFVLDEVVIGHMLEADTLFFPYIRKPEP